MDSPNSTTNMNSGSQLVIAPVELKPSSDSPQPCWNTSTSSPYAAPMDSRFSTIALAAITSDRNETSSSTNASSSTNTNTSGPLLDTCSLKSIEPAAAPVTCALAPGR